MFGVSAGGKLALALGLRQRPGAHGVRLWRDEFPVMAAWAFAREFNV